MTYLNAEEFFKELELPTKKKKKEYTKSRRIWLNRSTKLHAFAAYDFEREFWKGSISGYGTLTIADCSHQINLDISFGDERAKQGVLIKLDRLSKMIEEVRAEVEGTDMTLTEEKTD